MFYPQDSFRPNIEIQVFQIGFHEVILQHVSNDPYLYDYHYAVRNRAK